MSPPNCSDALRSPRFDVMGVGEWGINWSFAWNCNGEGCSVSISRWLLSRPFDGEVRRFSKLELSLKCERCEPCVDVVWLYRRPGFPQCLGPEVLAQYCARGVQTKFPMCLWRTFYNRIRILRMRLDPGLQAHEGAVIGGQGPCLF